MPQAAVELIALDRPLINLLLDNAASVYPGCTVAPEDRPVLRDAGKAFVEIAYFTFPPYEGKGYATAMARALTERAAVSRRVATEVAHTMPEKNASGRVLEKNGFALGGEMLHPEDGKVWKWQRGLKLFFVLALTLAAGACRKQEELQPAFGKYLPFLEKAEFTTISYTAQVQSFKSSWNGSPTVTSSGTLSVVIDGLKNRRLKRMVYEGDGEVQIELFDGKEISWILPAQKVAYSSDPLAPNYKVWNEGAVYRGTVEGQEAVRALQTDVIKTPVSTYWIYKGVAIQSEVKSDDMVTRTTLLDLVESSTPTAADFSIPKGYRRISQR